MSKKLKDLFPNYFANGGLFDYLVTAGADFITSPKSYNLKYIGQHSGNKATSSLLDDIAPDGVFVDEEASLTLLATTAYSLFGDNWGRLHDAFVLEYAPIENYNQIETIEETRDVTVDGTDVNTIARANSKEVELNETHNKGTEIDTTNTTVYGKVDSQVLSSDEVHTKATELDVTNTTAYGKVDNQVTSQDEVHTKATELDVTNTTAYGKVDSQVNSQDEVLTKATTDTTTYGKHSVVDTDSNDLNGVYSFNTPTSMVNTEEKQTTNVNTETLSGTDSVATTGTDSTSIDGTNVNTQSGSDVVTISEVNSGSDTDSIDGTNVNTQSGSDVVTINETNSGSDTDAIDGTNVNTQSGSDVVTVAVVNSGADTDLIVHAETGTDTGTETLAVDRDTHDVFSHTLTRKGNIGVTTSQQMLESELKLRAENFLCDFIFKDLDKLLTSPIYV